MVVVVVVVVVVVARERRRSPRPCSVAFVRWTAAYPSKPLSQPSRVQERKRSRRGTRLVWNWARELGLRVGAKVGVLLV